MKSLALTFMLFFLIVKLNILGQINHSCGNNSINKDKSLSDFSKMVSTTIMIKTKKKITLKILLVEFKDVKHRNPEYPSSLSLPAYSYDDFNNMLFSENQYCSPHMYSPDGQAVFGSLSDYYRIMSNNKLSIVGNVINEDLDHDNIPDWIILDSSKAYYHNNRGNKFREESKCRARKKGLNIETDENTFLVIIYAGHTYREWGNTLNPSAHFDDHDYIMGERFAPCFPYEKERDDSSIHPISKFAHIGIHAHEFGHLLGLRDHKGPEDNYNWDLMSTGVFNGPNRAGACPAPINPYDRSRLGWLQIIRFGDSTKVKMRYDLKNPHIYCMEDSKTYDFFLIEYRDFNLKMNLGNNIIPDYNSFITNVNGNNGLLIWRKIKNYNVKLLHSCGEKCSNSNHQIFPGEHNVRVLTPWSDNRDPRFGDFWVPNTKPGSRCGLEIKSIAEDHYLVHLYQKNPWLASPSKINKLEKINDDNIILHWDQKLEPDLDYYKIYQMNSDSSYSLYDTISNNYYKVSNQIYSFTSNDSNFSYYKISAIDLDDNESVFSNAIKLFIGSNYLSDLANDKVISNDFSLSQNYPNPFNPSTVISYSLSSSMNSETLPTGRQAANVRLIVFDILGKEVATLVNQKQNPGNYAVSWDASNLTSGVYFYQLNSGSFTKTKKMLMIK